MMQAVKLCSGKADGERMLNPLVLFQLKITLFKLPFSPVC